MVIDAYLAVSVFINYPNIYNQKYVIHYEKIIDLYVPDVCRNTANEGTGKGIGSKAILFVSDL